MEKDNIPEFYESDAEWESGEYRHLKPQYDRLKARELDRPKLEEAIGFLSAPDRERVLERVGYTVTEIAAYFKARGEGSLPCLQPEHGDVT